MASSSKNLHDLNETLAKFKRVRCKSSKDVQVGDIVACYVTAADEIGEPVDLGTVKYVAKGTQLPIGHPDGTSGDVFVLTYEKARLKKVNNDLTG